MSHSVTEAVIPTLGRAVETAHEAGASCVRTSKPSLADAALASSIEPPTPFDRGIDDVDIARMEEYSLLAALLARAPDAEMLKRVSEIRGNSTPLGLAHAALAQSARNTDLEHLDREFFDLFIGVGRGELLPYGSYYLTGFLNERPLARLRHDLRGLGIERAGHLTEPEDHASILCEIMAGLAGGRLPAAPESQRALFEKHLAPWIGRFFADLEALKKADFYRHVGTVGRLFIDLETKAFALAF